MGWAVRRSRAAGVALGLVGLAACDALLVEPAPTMPGEGMRLALEVVHPQASFGDLSLPLSAVRYVRFRLIREGGIRDTLVAARVDAGSVGARLTLLPDEARGWLEIEAELRTEGQLVMFRGRGLVHTYELTPAATIQIVPVAHSIGSSMFLRPSALLDTIPLVGQAIFANGIPIEGAPFEWETLDASIVEVIPGGRLVTRSNGTTTLMGSSLGATREFQVTVRQNPVSLTGIGPADTTVTVGASFRARPFGEDRNGSPLLPGAGVQWSARGGVTVDAEGVVRAQSSGVAFVDATYGTVVHTAQVNVTP